MEANYCDDLQYFIYFYAKLYFLKLCFNEIQISSSWKPHLQLPVQPLGITTKVVSSNPAHGKVYLIQHYVIKFVSDLRQVCDFFWYSGFIHQ